MAPFSLIIPTEALIFDSSEGRGEGYQVGIVGLGLSVLR